MVVFWVDPSGFGWVTISFSAVMTAFVGFPLEIAPQYLYSSIAFSIGIITEIVDRTWFETDFMPSI